MEKKTQLNLWYAAIAMAVLLAIQFATATPFESIAYSQFQAFLKDGKIEEVVVHQDRIEGKLKAPLENGNSYFVTPARSRTSSTTWPSTASNSVARPTAIG